MTERILWRWLAETREAAREEPLLAVTGEKKPQHEDPAQPKINKKSIC